MTVSIPGKALLFGMATAALGAPAAAETGDQPSVGAARQGTTHSLSAEEKERILAEAAERRAAAEQGGEAPKRRIHGEVGFMIGTGGTRAVHGSAMVPLGDEGVAAMSFQTGRYPGYGRHYYRHGYPYGCRGCPIF